MQRNVTTIILVVHEMEADGIQRRGFKIKRNVANITEAVQRKDCDITPENLRGYTSFMRKK
jgi:hypothetical protein